MLLQGPLLLMAVKCCCRWWSSLRVEDALKYDYKQFSSGPTAYGISAVLTPLTGERGSSHHLPATYVQACRLTKESCLGCGCCCGLPCPISWPAALVCRPDFSCSAAAFVRDRQLPVLLLMSFVMEPAYERQLAIYAPAPSSAEGGLAHELRRLLLTDPRAADLALTEVREDQQQLAMMMARPR